MTVVEAAAANRRLRVSLPRALVALGLLLLLTGIALGAWQGWNAYSLNQERQQVGAYTDGLVPLARDAGRLVRQTIAPALVQYGEGKADGGVIAAGAPTWQAYFQSTRKKFAAVRHPSQADAVARLFDRSLTEYATAVKLFGEEVSRPGATPAVLGPGVEVAREADHDYAAAAEALACLRESLGLPSVPEFKAVGRC